MQLAIIQAMEIGCFMLIPLDVICLAIGFGVQLLLLRKGKRAVFPLLLGIGLLITEVLCQCITGWDLLVYLLLYAALLLLLLGTALAFLWFAIRKRKAKETSQ